MSDVLVPMILEDEEESDGHETQDNHLHGRGSRSYVWRVRLPTRCIEEVVLCVQSINTENEN